MTKVTAFLMSFGGWLLHPNAHAQPNPRKPEHKCRPRIYSFICAESGSGKTPFFDQVVWPLFISVAGEPAFVAEHAHLLPEANDEKGLHFGQGTDADFCARMHSASGRLFWGTDEALGALDCDYAMGSAKQKDQSKLDFASLLSSVNGGPYGPRSLKSGGLSSGLAHVS